jgi:C-terminal peptidase prc
MSKLKRIVGLPVITLFTLFCGVPATLRAAEGAKANPHVVLIGISDYADKQIKPRPKAEDDAKALYDLFTSKDYLGVDTKNVRLLLGKADEKRNSIEATHKNILDAVKWLSKDCKTNDLVIFAFFGQGCSLGERGDRTCYFASDSTLDDRAKNAVAAADIAQEFDKLKSKHVCVLLDLNFKGFDAGKKSIPEPKWSDLDGLPYKEFLGDDEGEDHNPLPGRIIFMATNGLNPSIDLEDHGLFTRAVLDGLQGDADKAGYEPDGVITVDELSVFLNKHIPELKRKHGKTADARKTEHFIVGGTASHFPLTFNPKVNPKRLERLAAFDKVSDKLGNELTEEGHRLLSAMPKLEGMRSLRKEYQKFADGSLNIDQLKDKRETLLASMRLPDREARLFATKVLEGLQIVDDEYVKEVNKGELVGNAIRGLYRRIDEKVPEDINDKLFNVKKLGQGELGLLLQDARGRLGKREDLDNHKDIDVALQRALVKLDPYTTYIDPETVKRFEVEYKGEFDGIGVQIRKDSATDMLQVVTPIKGSPSYRIGLKAGDLITTVTREVDSLGNQLDKPEVILTKDVSLNDAVKKILGKAGTKVKLTVQREGEQKPLEFEIERGRIELESVFGVKRTEDDTWDYWLDKDAKIGYVRLSNFARNTASDLKRTVSDLRQQGMKGLVIDLRFNPGGLLESSRQICELFVGRGRQIVEIKQPRKDRRDLMVAHAAGYDRSAFEMVVLVNGYSASASEIVSACLQDHNRALIVGERSYGKGSVQNIQEFDGGQIKVTIASFWRPSGKNLNKSSTGGKEDEEWGVKPDSGYNIELSRKEREDLAEAQKNSEIIPRRDRPAKEPKTDFKDRQLDTALKYLREKQRASR